MEQTQRVERTLLSVALDLDLGFDFDFDLDFGLAFGFDLDLGFDVPRPNPYKSPSAPSPQRSAGPKSPPVERAAKVLRYRAVRRDARHATVWPFFRFP